MGQARLAMDVVLGGTYKIVGLVNAGGVGEVYEARHVRLSKKRFAVKVLLEEFSDRKDIIERFRREADILSELGHPNIVQVSDFAETPDGLSYLVMEYVDGLDLGREVRLHGPMPPARVANLVAQIASALDAVHSRGIVHRDLKPPNIMVTRLPFVATEVVKILDFGIAKAREASVCLTKLDSLLGTPQYMAPEQASGQLGDIDERTDQFALAAIAYELLIGEPPFGGEDPQAVLYRVIHEPPSPFRFPLPATERAILRGMSKNKAERFPSVREFSDAFAQAAAADACPPPVSPTLVVPPSDVMAQAEASPPDDSQRASEERTTLDKAARPDMGQTPFSPPKRRWRRGLAFASIAGVLLVVAGWWWAGVRRNPSPPAPSIARPPAPDPSFLPPQDTRAPDAGTQTSPPAAPPPETKPASKQLPIPRTKTSDPGRPAGRERTKSRNEQPVRNEEI